MNKKILFSICLILVAIIGFGSVSAADTYNSTLSDKQTSGIEQQNIDEIQNQNVINSTEKIVKEEVQTEKSINNISEVNDSTYKNKTPETINKNDIIKTENSTSSIQTEDDEEEEIHPGNGYTVEEVKEIREYIKYYKEHDYNLTKLCEFIQETKMFNGKLKDRADFDKVIKFFAVVHNQAMLERGYGSFYTLDEMLTKYAYCAVVLFWNSL